MRIPQQVAERVKEAPAQALRAVFSGIGQVLLVADRVKSRVAVPEQVQPAAAAAPRAQSRSGAAAPGSETRWRSLDQTGNVRVLSEEDAADAEPPEAEATAAPSPAAESSAAQPVAEPPVTEAVTEPAATGQDALPVPNYDDLSLASLRARLRNLDQSQVRMLLDYEKAHAGRADVLTMFERRITKLESGEA